MANHLNFNRGPTREKNFRKQWVAILTNRGLHKVEDIQKYLGEKLGIEVAISTIYSDLRELDEEYKSTALDELQQAKRVLIEQHTMLYQEAMKAWDDSIGIEEIVTEEDVVSGDGSVLGVKKKIVKKRSNGQIGYITAAERQLERMAKIVGADAAKQIEWQNTLPDGITPENALKELAKIIESEGG
jgi:hypothetical protein